MFCLMFCLRCKSVLFTCISLCADTGLFCSLGKFYVRLRTCYVHLESFMFV